MRAVQLSQGKPDEYSLPPDYVKTMMQCCAWAVLLQTLIVLALPLGAQLPAQLAGLRAVSPPTAELLALFDFQ